MRQWHRLGAFGFVATLVEKIDIRALLIIAATLAAPAAAVAQTDEIQVYDAAIAEKGKFNLMLHNNFTPNGRKTPAFPDGLISDRAYVGVAEWAYGVTDWFEQGLYLPLYSISKERGGSINGFKLRELFVLPHADDHRFFYGVNFEFSYNARYWDPKRITSEIRPIIGLHLHPIDLIVNPILDTSYDGFKNLDFAPATRLAYNLSPKWAVAAEEYADYGAIHKFNPVNDQAHQLYAVVDHESKFLNVEFGVGFGLTPATDKVTIKLMLSRDLN
jgi:hypothetical protein